MDRRKIFNYAPSLGYVFENGTIGRKITQDAGLSGMGSTLQDAKSIATQVLSVGASTPATQAILTRSTGFTNLGFGTVQQLAQKLAGGFNPPGGLLDPDVAVLSSALSDMNAALSGVAPTAPPVTALRSGQTISQQTMAALVAQFPPTLQAIPSWATDQASAILNRTRPPISGYPTFTVSQSIKAYSTPHDSPTTDADYAFLSAALTDLAALQNAPPPAAATPMPQTPTTYQQVNTNGQPVYVPPGSAVPVFPAGTVATYQPNSNTPSVVVGNTGTDFFSGVINLPLLGPVPTPYAIGGGLLLGLLVLRLARRNG